MRIDDERVQCRQCGQALPAGELTVRQLSSRVRAERSHAESPGFPLTAGFGVPVSGVSQVPVSEEHKAYY